MIMQLAAQVLWDGENTILLVCDPDMTEETRKKFYDRFMTLKVKYHSQEESKEICDGIIPAPGNSSV